MNPDTVDAIDNAVSDVKSTAMLLTSLSQTGFMIEPDALRPVADFLTGVAKELQKVWEEARS